MEAGEEGCILLGEVLGGMSKGWKELWPQTVLSQKEWEKYVRNNNSSVLSLKRVFVALAGLVFPLKTTPVSIGEGAREMEPLHSGPLWGQGGLRPVLVLFPRRGSSHLLAQLPQGKSFSP